MVLYELREVKHRYFTDTSPASHRHLTDITSPTDDRHSTDTITDSRVGRDLTDCRPIPSVDARPSVGWLWPSTVARGWSAAFTVQLVGSETGWFLDKLNCILFQRKAGHCEEFIRLLKSKMCIEATGRRGQTRRLTTYTLTSNWKRRQNGEYFSKTEPQPATICGILALQTPRSSLSFFVNGEVLTLPFAAYEKNHRKFIWKFRRLFAEVLLRNIVRGINQFSPRG